MKYLTHTWMRKVALGGIVALTVACGGRIARHDHIVGHAAVGTAQTARADTPGPTVVRHLLERYSAAEPNCKRNSTDPNPLPAVLCSGILLRATKRGVGFDIWNPNPASPTPNGVPFSWLRKDSGFSRIVYGYTNGFLILPHFYADDPADGYTQLVVRCVFPFDGATNGRTGGDRDGCGQYGNLAGTGPCQAQGITTAQQWLAKFGGGSLFGEQCGFRLLPGTVGAWQAFHAQTEIRAALSPHFATHNEIIVGTWAQNDRRLPLEAFFYTTKDFPDGLNEAKANQVDFKARTGRWVPVIRVDLPTQVGISAGFNFNPSEQAISE